MPRDHFDISDKSHDYNYSSRTGFPNDGRPIPQRDRAAHSQHVAQMFLAAKQENRQYRETAQLSSAPEGYYLKIQNQRGKDLALKNLDSRQIGHLINIREQGAGAEKMIEATLFLKEQKNEWLNRKIDEYQHQNTSKNKPRNQELIDTIEQITGAQLEDLWIGSESEPIPQDEKQWIEVWFFCELW